MIAPRAETYRLVIRSERGFRVPAEQRLRSLLKLMLRGFGFRVVEIDRVDAAAKERRDAIDEWLTW